MKHMTVLALALFVTASLIYPAQAEEDMISLSAGYYDISDDEEAVDYRAEYRWGEPAIWQLKPFIGIEGTSEGAIYGLGGVYLDWAFAPHWYLTPSFGAGLYSDGSGKDLGHVVEFRSTLELGYEFASRDRISVGFGHISNASIGDRNPGTEILSVYYHMPAKRILGGY